MGIVLTSFEMAEIVTETRLKRNLLNIETKITRYIHHKEFLQNYEANLKYPIGLALKFNLSLCTESPNLHKTCINSLRNASIQLLDDIIGGAIVKLRELSSIRNKNCNTLKETISSKELTKVCEEIRMEIELLSSSISKSHKRKYKRDKFTAFSHQRKNGRFRKSKRRRHNNERKNIYREKDRRMIKEAKTTSPEQNSINLSSKVLSPAEKSPLKRAHDLFQHIQISTGETYGKILTVL